MSQSQRARFDERFVPLAVGARELVRVYEDAIEHRHGHQPFGGDAYPEATTVRLMVNANPLYEMALLAIIVPEASLGSYAMYRPLLEAWAHLDFIAEADPAEWSCRALRLELGVVRQLIKTVKDGTDDPASVAERIGTARRREAIIEVQFSKRGCEGEPRSYQDSTASIREMAKREHLDWVLETWRASSMALHVTGWDWRLRTINGATHIVDSPPRELAAHLNHLVVIYASLAQTALRLFDADGADLHEAADAIANSKFLLRAIDGDYG